jgi:hypothetical protein
VPRSLALLALFLGGMVARADDPCAAFTWDVGRERALFASEPEILAAGTAVASPSLAPDRLYQLRLSDQPEVAFAVPPGKSRPTDGAYAGLANVTVDVAGVYRISLDQPSWLDVVVSGALIRSKDFQGRPDCNAPHKIVEFVLPAGTPLTLQFSGAASPAVKVTVTRSPVQVP